MLNCRTVQLSLNFHTFQRGAKWFLIRVHAQGSVPILNLNIFITSATVMNNLYSKSALQKLITYLYIVLISTLVLLAFESSLVKANWQPLNAWFFFRLFTKRNQVKADWVFVKFLSELVICVPLFRNAQIVVCMSPTGQWAVNYLAI